MGRVYFTSVKHPWAKHLCSQRKKRSELLHSHTPYSMGSSYVSDGGVLSDMVPSSENYSELG